MSCRFCAQLLVSSRVGQFHSIEKRNAKFTSLIHVSIQKKLRSYSVDCYYSLNAINRKIWNSYWRAGNARIKIGNRLEKIWFLWARTIINCVIHSFFLLHSQLNSITKIVSLLFVLVCHSLIIIACWNRNNGKVKCKRKLCMDAKRYCFVSSHFVP